MKLRIWETWFFLYEKLLFCTVSFCFLIYNCFVFSLDFYLTHVERDSGGYGGVGSPVRGLECRDYDGLQNQCEQAMHQLQLLRHKHNETIRRFVHHFRLFSFFEHLFFLFICRYLVSFSFFLNFWFLKFSFMLHIYIFSHHIKKYWIWAKFEFFILIFNFTFGVFNLILNYSFYFQDIHFFFKLKNFVFCNYNFLIILYISLLIFFFPYFLF